MPLQTFYSHQLQSVALVKEPIMSHKQSICSEDTQCWWCWENTYKSPRARGVGVLVAHFSLIGIGKDSMNVLPIVYWYERMQLQENMQIYISLVPNLIVGHFHLFFWGNVFSAARPFLFLWHWPPLTEWGHSREYFARHPAVLIGIDRHPRKNRMKADFWAEAPLAMQLYSKCCYRLATCVEIPSCAHMLRGTTLLICQMKSSLCVNSQR